MLLNQLHQQKQQIDALAAQYGAKHVRVFGSVARGEDSDTSDVDILIEFPQGYDLLKQRIPLTNQLASLIGRNVDLVPEHELNKYIRNDVLAEAVEL